MLPAAHEGRVRWDQSRAIRVRTATSVELTLVEVGLAETTRTSLTLLANTIHPRIPREQLIPPPTPVPTRVETGRKLPTTLYPTLPHASGCTLRNTAGGLVIRSSLTPWHVRSEQPGWPLLAALQPGGTAFAMPWSPPHHRDRLLCYGLLKSFRQRRRGRAGTPALMVTPRRTW